MLHVEKEKYHKLFLSVRYDKWNRKTILYETSASIEINPFKGKVNISKWVFATFVGFFPPLFQDNNCLTAYVEGLRNLFFGSQMVTAHAT